MKRRTHIQWLGLALAAAVSGTRAQVSAGRTLRLIVPNPAGSATDHVARVIGPHLGTLLGQNVVVDNKAGANGIIAVQDLMRAPADGSVMMLGSLSPLAINVALMKNLPYDPRRDLTPIAGAYLTNQVLMVKASSPARSLGDFITQAKAQPGKLTVGHSTSLVQTEIASMEKLAGVTLMPVPYKGIPASVNDVMGGTLDATFVDMVNAVALVKNGQMRPLAVTSIKRNPVVPEWPAISETLPGFDFTSWSAFVGPRGMPGEVVNRINTALGQVLKQKEVLEKFEQSGILPWTTSPDELKAYMDGQAAMWVRLARELKLQTE